MSIIRCPACGASDLIEARDRSTGKPMPVVELTIARGRIKRREVGACVVCAVCETPFAVRPDGMVPSLKRDAALRAGLLAKAVAGTTQAGAVRPAAPRHDPDMGRTLDALASPIRPEPDDLR